MPVHFVFGFGYARWGEEWFMNGTSPSRDGTQGYLTGDSGGQQYNPYRYESSLKKRTLFAYPEGYNCIRVKNDLDTAVPREIRKNFQEPVGKIFGS